jgi:hypothetical protein
MDLRWVDAGTARMKADEIDLLAPEPPRRTSEWMRKKSMWLIIGIVAIALLAAALWGPIASNVEQPQYRVVDRNGNIEIRDYAPMIVAETEVTGERHEAINRGFRVIVDYIFGNNTVAQKVPMTAPVTQQSSAGIAMTAPVTQQSVGNAWRVRFIMPSKYTMETLPKPNNPAVELKQVPVKRFAVIRFSGSRGEDSLKSRTKELNAFVSAKKFTPLSEPTYAFYNPPWTLPFLRRNEVMVEIPASARD